jgi:hypothetical protein
MRTSPFSICFVLLLPLLGCGSRHPERAKVYPARGAVFFNGKPAAGAVVRLHAPGGAAVLALGTVQPDGAFALTTYESGDGAPAGRYRASVSWRRQGPEEGQEGPPLIPQRYFSPESSGLEVEIKAEPENRLAPFVLKP